MMIHMANRVVNMPKVKRTGKYERYYLVAERRTAENPLDVKCKDREGALNLYRSARSQQAGLRPWLRSGLRETTVYLWREVQG
jgi:hypothetical protein